MSHRPGSLCVVRLMVWQCSDTACHHVMQGYPQAEHPSNLQIGKPRNWDQSAERACEVGRSIRKSFRSLVWRFQRRCRILFWGGARHFGVVACAFGDGAYFASDGTGVCEKYNPCTRAFAWQQKLLSSPLSGALRANIHISFASFSGWVIFVHGCRRDRLSRFIKGVQWKQGVVICMLSCTSSSYIAIPIRRTPLPMHSPVRNSQVGSAKKL